MRWHLILYFGLVGAAMGALACEAFGIHRAWLRSCLCGGTAFMLFASYDTIMHFAGATHD
jgi:hypothetical protein